MTAVARFMSVNDEPAPPRPPLVIVSGAPASGKTTLATTLARELRLPLLAKDELKEVLFDTLGAPDVETARRLAGPAYEVLWTILGRLLDAGVGAVVESNFYRGFSEAQLQPFVDRARAVLIHCHAPRDVLAQRYAERFQRGERHPAHFDGDQIERLLANLDAGSFGPLALDVPTRVVDTTADYIPSLPEILEFIHQHTN